MPSVNIGDYSARTPPFANGGFGSVHVARNKYDHGYCALKVVKATHSSVELSGLQLYRTHVNNEEYLVPILHVGQTHAGEVYFAMPLALDQRGRPPDPPRTDYEAMTLARHYLRKGGLRLSEVLEIGERVGLALWRLHQEQLVHCDVKPANILHLAGRGWMLGDFGLLRNRHPTAKGGGTPWFIPPEGTGDYLADVYALGKTLVLLSTGRQPGSHPDPCDVLYTSPRIAGANTKQTQRLKELVQAACQDPTNKRISLHDLLYEMSSLSRSIERRHWQFETPEHVSIEEIKKALRNLGSSAGTISEI